MKKTLLCSAILLITAFPVAAQQPVSPMSLSEAQDSWRPMMRQLIGDKRELAKVEKEREKYPDWVSVFETASYAPPAQAVGFVGWCGGNLNWMFCASQPIMAGGAEQVRSAAFLNEEKEKIVLACQAGWRLCAKLPRGGYPARRGKNGTVEVYAFVDGKMKNCKFRYSYTLE